MRNDPAEAFQVNTLAAKPLAQCLFLRLEVFDNGLLVSTYPTREDKERELKVQIRLAST